MSNRFYYEQQDYITQLNNMDDVAMAYDKKYLGAKAADPTLDNQGAALAQGAQYYNTVSQVMRIYTGTAWINIVAPGSTYYQDFNGDGSTVDFTLTNNPGGIANTQVYLNGVYQQKTTYTVSGAVITFSTAPPVGTSNIEVVTSLTFTVADVIPMSSKDAAGGVVGMTLQKINFKNVLNTNTSFLTNSNTAARTYTFQDKDGTIADTADVALVRSDLAGAGGAALVGWIRAKTGAVAKTLAQWFGYQQPSIFDFLTSAEIADVQAGTYGIDVTAKIQAAIDSYNPYSIPYLVFSGELKAPAGGYLVTNIKLRNGVVIRGDGRATSFKSVTNSRIFEQSANTTANGLQTFSSFGLLDLNIIGANTLCDGLFSAQDAIYLSNSDTYNSASYSRIENVHIFWPGGNGIHCYKPTVSNAQYGWTQFGRIHDVVIQGSYGYAILADGVTGDSDFASMSLRRVFCSGGYTGGVKLTGGNDNYLQILINNTGTCVTPTGTYTNASCAAPLTLNNQLSTDVKVHIENTANANGVGIEVGAASLCYTTHISGIFYNLKTPIKITSANSTSIDDVIFLGGTVGTALITNASGGRYTSIGKNWYNNVNGALLLSDANAGGTYAASGYITTNAIGLGPDATLTGAFAGTFAAETSVQGLTVGKGNGVTTGTAFGYQALKNATGAQNTGIGYGALTAMVGGTYNTAVGLNALTTSTAGIGNTAVGQTALAVSTSHYNVGVGVGALAALTTGNNTTAVGRLAGTALTTSVNCSLLGANTTVTGDNQVQLGDSSTTTYVYGTVQNRSDLRDKADVRGTVLGLDFIRALRPVDYRYDYREDYHGTRDGSKKHTRFHHGLIAQEVKSVADMMGVDFGGYQNHALKGGEDVLSIGYDELIAPLIKALQEVAQVQQTILLRIEEAGL